MPRIPFGKTPEDVSNDPVDMNKVDATPKSKSKPHHKTTMGINTVEIIDDDDDDEVSLHYETPLPTSRKSGCIPNNVISVEQYAHDRELQLALIMSLFPQTRRPKRGNQRRIIDLDAADDDEVQFLDSSVSFKQTPLLIEIGESSNSHTAITFICEICVETKPCTESFSIVGCTHSYCSDCVIKYVASKLEQNITKIRCPVSDCNKGLVEPEHCRLILPPEVFDRWGSALCEAVILASEKFYCPFKDCSALMIDESCGGDEVIAEAECPNCWRLFCAQCKVPWHSGIQCGEFQKLNKDERGRDDVKLMQLAKENKWSRCPKCKFYVEKSEGCLFILCRCGHSFCYNCGASMKTHYCEKCKR